MFAPKPILRTPGQQRRLNAAAMNLSLYQSSLCPYCIRVNLELVRLGLPVERRDVLRNREHRETLLAGGGRTTVPCLLMRSESGEEIWMYESSDIIQWLRQNFETLPENIEST